MSPPRLPVTTEQLDDPASGQICAAQRCGQPARWRLLVDGQAKAGAVICEPGGWCQAKTLARWGQLA